MTLRQRHRGRTRQGRGAPLPGCHGGQYEGQPSIRLPCAADTWTGRHRWALPCAFDQLVMRPFRLNRPTPSAPSSRATTARRSLRGRAPAVVECGGRHVQAARNGSSRFCTGAIRSRACGGG